MLQLQRLMEKLVAHMVNASKYSREKLEKLGCLYKIGFLTLETSKQNNMNTTKQQIIESTKGKFFSVLYRNKLGDVSKYVVRTGVKKNLKGGTNHAPKGTVTLYAVSKDGDRSNFGYRTLYLDNIREVKAKNWEVTSVGV